MVDYKDVWVKWIAFLNMDLPYRKRILESLNIEVTRGLDVVGRIAVEEIEASFTDKKSFDESKSAVERTISYSVWSGYALFLVFEGIDPEKENLVASEATAELGRRWFENYEKDQNREYTAKIDDFLTILIEKNSSILMNTLFLEKPEIQKNPYNSVKTIENFANWVAVQGFIFGIIEQELNTKKKNP